MDNLKFRLAAEVIKFYRQDPEERALADLIVYQLGLTLQEAHALSVDELEQLIANLVTCNDDVPLPPRGKDKGVRRNGNQRKGTTTRETIDSHDSSDRLIGVDGSVEVVGQSDVGGTDITS